MSDIKIEGYKVTNTALVKAEAEITSCVVIELCGHKCTREGL